MYVLPLKTLQMLDLLQICLLAIKRGNKTEDWKKPELNKDLKLTFERVSDYDLERQSN
jgi:hypothetical protein